MTGTLSARVTLRVADGRRPPVALPTFEPVSVGRTSGYGLHLDEAWVPRKLCRFLPWESGWVIQVGPRVRMEVRDHYVGKHVFGADGMVAAQEGPTLLSFPELDDTLQLGLVIGPGADAGAPPVRDDQPERTGDFTAYAAASIDLTPVQRQTVAVTFFHLLLGRVREANLAAAAAERLGRSEAAVKKSLKQVMDKLNLERWGPDIETYDQLGHYLVTMTRTVTAADLPPAVEGDPGNPR